MEKLTIELKNCYGIAKLEEELDFSGEKRVNVIYAPNGSMKTSFARTFEMFSQGKRGEIKDEFYPKNKPSFKITDENNEQISKENVFVITSDDLNYQAKDIETLLVNDKMKSTYKAIRKNIDEIKQQLLNELGKLSGHKKNNEIEKTISLDTLGEDGNFFDALKKLKAEILEDQEQNLPKIVYITIINDKTEELLNKENFVKKLEKYTEQYEALLEKSKFFRKGKFNHHNANQVLEELDKNGYFDAEHSLQIMSENITDKESLQKLIDREMEMILSDESLKKSFNEMSKIINKNSGLRNFGKYLEYNPAVIPRLHKDNRGSLKKSIWKSYLIKYKTDFEELMAGYGEEEENIKKIKDQAKDENTKWGKAIEIFKQRFRVPFIMEIENRDDVILGDGTPNIKFLFQDRRKKKVATNIENLSKFLSSGEKRALYILNIIFEIETRKTKGQETLFVIDDIADSFDYKNKYAIVEYLNEMQEKNFFRQIILTHNYDFYRTVCGRLGLGRKKSGMYQVAKNTSNNFVNLVEDTLINPFEKWKKETKKAPKENMDMLIAMIPFVRNLSEYCGHKCVQGKLSHLLHIKRTSKDATLGEIQEYFREVIKDYKPKVLASSEKSVRDAIYCEADKICSKESTGAELEKKIVLSIAIRLKAEEFMISRIKDKTKNDSFPDDEEIKGNQTIKLIKKYKDFCEDEESGLAVMEEVNLMTPENIHLNSFMYEPIIDTSPDHLKSLYKKVKDFQEGTSNPYKETMVATSHPPLTPR